MIHSPVPALDRSKLRFAVVYTPVSELRLPTNQLRKRNRALEKRIALHLRDVGFIMPITIYDDNTVATGHSYFHAAVLAGIDEVPCISLSHLTKDEARLFAIAHRKFEEGREWNLDALRIEFAEISISSPTLDLGRSEFTIAQRDIIFGNHRAASLNDFADDVPPALAAPVSRVGDVFALGRHRLACGSALDRAVVSVVTEGEAVRAVVSDLPYDVKIASNVSGNGKVKHREFVQASGEMSSAEFTDFLETAMAAAIPMLSDGALMYLFMDWRHLTELHTAAQRNELAQLNLLVWAKTNAGMGSFYRSAHEMIGVYKSGTAAHINNVMLGRDGRNRTNVLHYPGANTFTKGRAKALEMHPTVKPVALIADLILDSTGPGDLVLDMFGGSGTTIIAAEKTDRRAALIELDPQFVDVSIRRFEGLTGTPAVHLGTGQTFQELVADRGQQEVA